MARVIAVDSSAAMLQADVSDADTPAALKQRSQALFTQAKNALQKLQQHPLKPLLDALALRGHTWELPQQDLSPRLGGLAPLPRDGLRIRFRKL